MVRRRQPRRVTADAERPRIKYAPNAVRAVTLHDGSVVAWARWRQTTTPLTGTPRTPSSPSASGEVPTGLLYIDPESVEMNAGLGSVERPLVDLPFEDLCPGDAVLQELMEGFR